MDKKEFLKTLQSEYVLQKARYEGAKSAYESAYIRNFIGLSGLYKDSKFSVQFKEGPCVVVVSSWAYENWGEKEIISVYGYFTLKSGKVSKEKRQVFTDLEWYAGHVKKVE